MQRCIALNAKCNKLFDIFCTDEVRRKTLEEAYKIPMGNDEFDFLSSMRTDRAATCGKVDLT